MKKFLLLAALLSFAFSVSAAQITNVDIESDNVEVELSFVYAQSDEAQIATILVLPSDKSIVSYDDADISYMSQKSVEGDSVTFRFPLPDASKTYNYYLGGIALDSYASGTIALVDDGLVRIRGSVSVRGGANITRVSASANGVSVNVDANGSYIIKTAPGTYDVTIGREGYLYRVIRGVDASQSVRLENFVLHGGDVTADGAIDSADLQEVLTYWGKSGEEYPALDINDDGVIDLVDFQIILANEGKRYE